MNTQPLIGMLYCTQIYLLLAITCSTSAIPTPHGHHNRLSFPGKFWKLKSEGSTAMGTAAGSVVGAEVIQEPGLAWRGLLYKEPSKNNNNQSFTIKPDGKKRSRRHASLGSQHHVHGQLMRVGCVLGTCQVQNLSYRLYQIVGQNRRQQSSPVNPRSPHSYG